ncbi:MAG: Ku protein [Acidobacteriota bacterium]|nr:Ku protein [Acidobacteriota bacterium]
MAHSVWRGSLSFGLLTIPVRLFTAARSERMNLHQIHRECKTRLRQPLFCATCERNVERSEVIRGYEHDDSQYVLVEDEDIKKITPRSSRTMEIMAFVKEEQIDPIYFDSSYFALPEKDSEKPYALLLKALEDKNRVAIATVTMHQREYTVFIRPREHGLTVHTMYFENEIRHVEGYGKTDQNIKLKPQEIKLAEQLVDTLSEDFDASKYHDTFQDNLKALIAAKQKGKTIVEQPKAGTAPVIDMMEALKRSLRQSEAANKHKPSNLRTRDHESRRRLAS